MATISQVVNFDMLEKLADGTYKKKHPETKASQAIIQDTAGNFASNDVEGALAETAQQISTKSGKSTIQNKTLLAASWTGTAVPYSYSLTVAGVTTTSVQEILPTTDITVTQLTALIGATIQDGGQSVNTIVLKTWGTKPTIDIPIRVILRGDM